MADDEEGLLWEAVNDVVKRIAHLDSETRLENKIRAYFKKAVKNVEMGKKPWHVLINDYADSAIGAVFCGLGERDWLYRGEADFMLVLDAAIKDLFPPRIMKGVPQLEFERAVLHAHDRSFEEQRYLAILGPVLQDNVQGKATSKKVYTALETGQKEAFAQGSNGKKDYARQWIDCTIAKLANDSQGEPESVLPIQKANQMFGALVNANALPIPFLSSKALPPGFLMSALETAYARHSTAKVAGSSSGSAFEAKGKLVLRARPY